MDVPSLSAGQQDPSDATRRFLEPAGSPPLMRSFDGGAGRQNDDPDVRAARWFRLFAAMLRYGAGDLEGTPHHASLVRQAFHLDTYADELVDERASLPLRLV